MKKEETKKDTLSVLATLAPKSVKSSSIFQVKLSREGIRKNKRQNKAE